MCAGISTLASAVARYDPASPIFIPCGPIYSIDQVFADPQVKHLGMATKMSSPHVGEAEVVASAINISGFSKAVRAHTPDPGEHGDEILKSVGYTDAELADMRQKGVI